MKKILIYALSENLGGVEEFVLNLSRYKKSNDHEYGYIILGDHSPYEDEMKRLGVEYYKIPKKRYIFKNIMASYYLIKKLSKFYDLLYINTSSLGFIWVYILAIKFKMKLVLHSHLDASKTSSNLKKIIHHIHYKMIKKYLKERFACSVPAGKWMFGKDQFSIIPNAINIDRFKYNKKSRSKLREELHIENYFVIGNIGRLTDFKNQIFLLKILRKLSDQKVKLLLVGDGEDKEMLIEKAREFKIDDRVIFYGKTKHPEYIYSCIDCLVMPSKAEGFPITLVEAQASGLPCIVSNVITRETNITNNVTYLSIEENNLDQWIDAIEKSKNSRIFNGTKYLENKGYNVYNLETLIWERLKKYE